MYTRRTDRDGRDARPPEAAIHAGVVREHPHAGRERGLVADRDERQEAGVDHGSVSEIDVAAESQAPRAQPVGDRKAPDAQGEAAHATHHSHLRLVLTASPPSRTKRALWRRSRARETHISTTPRIRCGCAEMHAAWRAASPEVAAAYRAAHVVPCRCGAPAFHEVRAPPGTPGVRRGDRQMRLLHHPTVLRHLRGMHAIEHGHPRRDDPCAALEQPDPEVEIGDAVAMHEPAHVADGVGAQQRGAQRDAVARVDERGR